MKAIVSKSSTCQETNCPLYLVATFTVEVHFDSCFLSPREGCISPWVWVEGRENVLSIFPLIGDSSEISDWALVFRPTV